MISWGEGRKILENNAHDSHSSKKMFSFEEMEKKKLSFIIGILFCFVPSFFRLFLVASGINESGSDLKGCKQSDKVLRNLRIYSVTLFDRVLLPSSLC